MPMDETLGVAAIDLSRTRPRGRRSAARGRAGRGSPGGAGRRFLRRVRAGRARQRAPEGALRPLEPPPDRGAVQGVRTGAALRLLARPADGPDASQHERSALRWRGHHRPHRLRRRQPDVRAQGFRRDRRRARDAAVAGGPGWGARDRRSRRRPFPGHVTARWRVESRDPRGCRRRARRCWAFVSACNGCSSRAPKPRTSPASGLMAGRCERLPPVVKVPHVGWNALDFTRESRLLAGISGRSGGLFHPLLRRARDR